jgi:hypothetical protein
VKKKFVPFLLFDLAFYYFFSFLFDFLSPFVFSFFFVFVLYLFFAYMVSSLAYLTCLGIKNLIVVIILEAHGYWHR